MSENAVQKPRRKKYLFRYTTAKNNLAPANTAKLLKDVLQVEQKWYQLEIWIYMKEWGALEMVTA